MRVLQFAQRSVLTVAVLGLALSACSDSTAPDAPFDPAGTSADVASIDEAFESPAAQSYAAVGAEISAVAGGSFNGAVGAMPSAATFASRSSAVRYAQKMVQLYSSRATGGPSFSGGVESYAGTTFIWDVNTDQYVASELPGAPAKGVRFRLYSINPATGKPTEPLVDVGYVDVTATSTNTSFSLRVKVVSGALTYLDYLVTAFGTQNTVTIRVAGYASNGTDRAEFNLSHAFSFSSETSGTLNADYVFAVPTRGFKIDMEITLQFTAESSSLTLDLEMRGEHGTVRLTGSETSTGGSFTVRVNGDVLATITVDAAGYADITGADGHALTEEEAQALWAVFGVFAEGLDFFDGLTDPIA